MYKVGDKVVVIKPVTPKGKVEYGFTKEMVKYIGQTMTVKKANEESDNYTLEEAFTDYGEKRYYWGFLGRWLAPAAENEYTDFAMTEDEICEILDG